MTGHPEFKGYIQDIGGPTANMYGFECERKQLKGGCKDRRCIFPEICPNLKPDHSAQIDLLKKIRKIPGVKKAFVASGIRYDLLLNDRKNCPNYLKEVASCHVSGQMKAAPEHSVKNILDLMGKPDTDSLLEFKKLFDRFSKSASKKQFLTYYFIAAHPGCRLDDMRRLKRFIKGELNINPEQVQIFTPTPSTWSTLMYYAGINPFTGEKIFVEKTYKGKVRQKAVILEGM